MTTIVAISGSLRERSSNSALLRIAASVAPEGTDVVMYGGVGTLPHFTPDLDSEGSTPPEPVRALRELLIRSDAVLISCPEYAHGVPGAFKNMLDWLVSTGELVGKPIALINAAPAGGEFAHRSLIETLRTMNWRVVEDASLIQPFLPRKLVTDAVDDESRKRIRDAVAALVRATQS
ncbi:MAG TPA: NAD(P)H-dependent oxidoreductase [Thermoanaerobaculia bacterium]